MAHELLTPDTCALALIDYQPQCSSARIRTTARPSCITSRSLQKTAKLFKIPTILTTIAAQSFSGAFIPEPQAVFPEQKPIDRTSIELLGRRELPQGD